MVRVLVVDDQEPYRRAMAEVVEATAGFSLAGAAESGEAALEAATDLSPSLVIMDKRMPGMGGLEATRALTARAPALVVLLVSVEDPDLSVARAAGARAVAHKRDLSPSLLQDIWRDSGA